MPRSEQFPCWSEGLSFFRVTGRWWGSNHTLQVQQSESRKAFGQLCLSEYLGTLAMSVGVFLFPHNPQKFFLLCLWNWIPPELFLLCLSPPCCCRAESPPSSPHLPGNQPTQRNFSRRHVSRGILTYCTDKLLTLWLHPCKQGLNYFTLTSEPASKTSFYYRGKTSGLFRVWHQCQGASKCAMNN